MKPSFRLRNLCKNSVVWPKIVMITIPFSYDPEMIKGRRVKAIWTAGLKSRQVS